MIHKELQNRILSSIIIIPLSLFFIIKGSTYFILFLTILFFISCLEWLKMNKKILSKLLGILFLLFSFYSSYLLRNDDLGLFLFILLICISTDLGGYIFGKFLKGPKLIKISPNKTYSGMIGSFLLAIFVSYVFLFNFNLIFVGDKNISENYYFIILVLLISAVSQIGDLIISFFKRSSNIKNTGKIFPGHGGLLDRIDGMIFVFPTAYMITMF